MFLYVRDMEVDETENVKAGAGNSVGRGLARLAGYVYVKCII